MGRGRQAVSIQLSAGDRDRLVAWARRRKTSQALALRARIVLMAGDGASNKGIAQALGVTNVTAGKWRRRFAAFGVDGLLDEPRPGAPRKVGDAEVERLIVTTLETMPRGATHWSTRRLAQQAGISHMTVHRVWRAFRLQPHRVETFKLSTDPLFVDKVRDIVGLYLNPPERALVLCVDEKSQIQALDRTQPLLPMRPGQAERRAHDYRRHGTTSLFAALDVATGKVIGKCYGRHRAREFRDFLDRIDQATPKHLAVHLILDNYATHKTATIQHWLKRHPRFHLHFTPTGASWLNLVERWFAKLTDQQIRRGVHRSVRSLIQAIDDFIAINNQSPKPFVWVKTADDILASIQRFAQRTLQQHGNHF